MQSTDEAIKLAHEIGFPVMIKVGSYYELRAPSDKLFHTFKNLY